LNEVVSIDCKEYQSKNTWLLVKLVKAAGLLTSESVMLHGSLPVRDLVAKNAWTIVLQPVTPTLLNLRIRGAPVFWSTLELFEVKHALAHLSSNLDEEPLRLTVEVFFDRDAVSGSGTPEYTTHDWLPILSESALELGYCPPTVYLRCTLKNQSGAVRAVDGPVTYQVGRPPFAVGPFSFDIRSVKKALVPPPVLPSSQPRKPPPQQTKPAVEAVDLVVAKHLPMLSFEDLVILEPLSPKKLNPVTQLQLLVLSARIADSAERKVTACAYVIVPPARIAAEAATRAVVGSGAWAFGELLELRWSSSRDASIFVCLKDDQERVLAYSELELGCGGGIVTLKTAEDLDCGAMAVKLIDN
jgi:hypothetical protein